MDSFLSFARISLLYQEPWFLALMMLVPWDPLKVPIPDLPLGHIHHWKKTPEWLTENKVSGVCEFLPLLSFMRLLSQTSTTVPCWYWDWVSWEQWETLSATPQRIRYVLLRKHRKAGWDPISAIWPLSSGWGQVDSWALTQAYWLVPCSDGPLLS